MLNEHEFNKLYAEGEAYINMGKYQKAEGKFKYLLEAKPQNPELLAMLGYCCYLNGKNVEAIDLYKQALEKNYDLEMGSYLLGCAYSEIKKYSNAEMYLIESLRINPQNASALAEYAMILLKTRHIKEAEEYMKEALRLGPHEPSVLKTSFNYYCIKNNKKEQANSIKDYINNSGGEVSKYVMIGVYNLNIGLYKEAAENLRQAFLLKPDDNNILQLLEEAEKHAKVSFLSNRIINKIGGPAGVMIMFFVLLTIATYLKNETLAIVIVFGYIILVVTSWIGYYYSKGK